MADTNLFYGQFLIIASSIIDLWLQHPLREGAQKKVIRNDGFFYLIEGLKIHSIFDYAKIR